mgnify:CR=1 FL=1
MIIDNKGIAVNRFSHLLLAGTMLAPTAAFADEAVPADAAFDAGATGTVIVVTGTADGYRPVDANAVKTPTPLVDVPQTITVLTRDQLDDQAVTQLGDALRYVPGVVLGQGEGHRDQITLRGQNTSIGNPEADGGISIAGSNPRTNRISIDGVQAQDDFGLNTGGLPTRRYAVIRRLISRRAQSYVFSSSCTRL